MTARLDLSRFRGRVLLADGAWGTELQRRGLPLGEPSDLWNLSRPGEVRAVARSYAQAGSRIVLTNTLCANRIELARLGFTGAAAAVAEAGARLSREGAGSGVLVFGSMGPVRSDGSGGIAPRELEAAFAEQAEALRRGGADAIVVETMTDLEETRVAVRCAAATGLPVVASFTYSACDEGGCSTSRGVTPFQAIEALVPAGASALGANCGNGMDGFSAIVRSYRESWDGPIWAKPSAGIPRRVGGELVYALTPDDFAEGLERLVAAGANIVGGCCGTTPESIAAAARRLAGRL